MGLLGVSGGLLVTTVTAGTSAPLLQQMGMVMGGGAGLGAAIASKAGVTDLPQLVAGFHSLVGVAAGVSPDCARCCYLLIPDAGANRSLHVWPR